MSSRTLLPHDRSFGNLPRDNSVATGVTNRAVTTVVSAVSSNGTSTQAPPASTVVLPFDPVVYPILNIASNSLQLNSYDYNPITEGQDMIAYWVHNDGHNEIVYNGGEMVASAFKLPIPVKSVVLCVEQIYQYPLNEYGNQTTGSYGFQPIPVYYNSNTNSLEDLPGTIMAGSTVTTTDVVPSTVGYVLDDEIPPNTPFGLKVHAQGAPGVVINDAYMAAQLFVNAPFLQQPQ